MKSYTIELDETTAEFLEYISKSRNTPAQTIISDTVFNMVEKINEKINSAFIVNEIDL